jgi:hypothetical protein
MSNLNSVADVIIHQNNSQPITLSVPAQAHTQFLLGANAALLSIPNPMATVDSALAFPGRSATAVPILIKAAGTMQLGRGVVYQIDINQGTGLTPAIATTGPQTSPLGAGLYNDNWSLTIEGMWDATSLNFRGIFYGWCGLGSVAQATLVGSAPAALANLQFNVAVTILNANASNAFTLNEFSASLD